MSTHIRQINRLQLKLVGITFTVFGPGGRRLRGFRGRNGAKRAADWMRGQAAAPALRPEHQRLLAQWKEARERANNPARGALSMRASELASVQMSIYANMLCRALLGEI